MVICVCLLIKNNWDVLSLPHIKGSLTKCSRERQLSRRHQNLCKTRVGRPLRTHGSCILLTCCGPSQGRNVRLSTPGTRQHGSATAACTRACVKSAFSSMNNCWFSLNSPEKQSLIGMPCSYPIHCSQEKGNTAQNAVPLAQGTTKDQFLPQEVWVWQESQSLLGGQHWKGCYKEACKMPGL